MRRDEIIDKGIEGAKQRAIDAWSQSTRMGVLRVGDPWSPIAEAIAFCGCVIANGNKDRYRTWGQLGPEWTADIDVATWYVRREDAERVCAEDEDACFILNVQDVIADLTGERG